MDVSSMMSILESVQCTNREGGRVEFYVKDRKITVPRHKNLLSRSGGFGIAIDLVEKNNQLSCIDIIHDETVPLKQICRYDDNKLFIISDAGTKIFLNFSCEAITIRSVRSAFPQKNVREIHILEGTVIRTLDGRKTIEAVGIGDSALVNDMKSGELQVSDIWHIRRTHLPPSKIGKIRRSNYCDRLSYAETLVPVGSWALLGGSWEVVDMCKVGHWQGTDAEDGLMCYSINIDVDTAISMNGIYVWNKIIDD